MKKYLKNNIAITLILIFSSFMITILYYLKGIVQLTAVSFLGNILIIFSSILGMVISGCLFLLAVDTLFLREKKFKERFFYVTKSLWISQLTIFPVIIVLFLANLFLNLKLSLINKIIICTISHLSQISLFFSYKFITKYDWLTTIKIVASQSILSLLILQLLKLV